MRRNSNLSSPNKDKRSSYDNFGILHKIQALRVKRLCTFLIRLISSTKLGFQTTQTYSKAWRI